MDDDSGESVEDDVTGVGRGDGDEVDGERPRAGSSDKVKHIEKNEQLFVTKMI